MFVKRYIKTCHLIVLSRRMQNIDIESLTESERHELLVKLLKENVDIEGLKEITSITNNRIIWCDDMRKASVCKKYKCDVCNGNVWYCKEAAHYKTINHQKALKRHLKKQCILDTKKQLNNESPTITIEF